MSSQPHATTPLASSGAARSWAQGQEFARGRLSAWRLTSVRGVATASVTLLVAVALCVPIGAAAQIVLAAQLDDRTPTQAMIMLDPVRTWGDAAPVIDARAAHAAELYREGVAPVIMLPGTHRSTERGLAALERAGVPAADVVVVESGADTVGSLRAMAEVMRGLGWSAATIVTDPAQAARVQATAGSLGLDAHLSPTDDGPGTSLTSEYVGRETLALLRYYALTRWSLPQVVRSS